MNGQQILDKFHTYTDDQSELSAQEELDLMNNIYQDVYTERHWEWLKTQASGNAFDVWDTVNGIYAINLEDDFIAFAENNNMTDNTFEPENNAQAKVVYIYTADGKPVPYQLVNFSDRRQYFGKNGFCYTDYANNRIVFTQPPVSQQYEYDYIAKPPALTLATSPVFDSDYHQIIVHGMAIDHEVIQLFDRAHSYAGENTAKYQKYLSKLTWANAQLLLN